MSNEKIMVRLMVREIRYVLVLKSNCLVLDLYQLGLNEQATHLMEVGTYDEAGI